MNGIKYSGLLEGKNAVVTSGAHGMGRHVAEVLAQQGARVAINGLNPSGVESGENLNKISPGSFFVQCDMSQPEAVDNFIGETLKRMGHVDVVANVVGINLNEDIDQVKDDRFGKTQQVNIRGAIRLSRAFTPGMIKAGGGAFVHISTVHSIVGIPKNTAYASSKAAINAFSCAFAAAYAKYNVRSNVICPGGINSKIEGYFEALGDDPEKIKRQIAYNSPGQFDYGHGSVYDIANSTLYLLSDMSRKVTGQILLVDGGCILQSHNVNEYRVPEEYEDIWYNVLMGRFKQPEY